LLVLQIRRDDLRFLTKRHAGARCSWGALIPAA